MATVTVYRVSNPGDVKVQVYDEKGVRHLLAKGEWVEFTSKHNANTAANDYNASTLSNVKLEVATVIITDEPVTAPATGVILGATQDHDDDDS